MASRRVNSRAVKLHRSYSVSELAACFGVHKNTVRQWQRDGLKPIDSGRPVLFQGAIVRAFLSARNASRKRPCPPGTLYCFRCREPRPPALGMVDYLSLNAKSGNVRAICATCETVMHRRASKAALAAVLPGCDIQFVEALPRLKGSPAPSLNCDLETQAAV
ncbi:helix-turn-helix domain-containing protein [Sphingomonas sp. URHD0057]|uniref:helix-turn-helix domain-containing protein n=1 Tax=Sphingomonas sp. URHD0057 TaxID=1380389 RepID=UPI00056D7996|nr:helix-turn-helix domain-containing protein [Sphingomonas sp. URHD0057]